MRTNRKFELPVVTSNQNDETSTPPIRRTLALMGASFFVAGIFLFTRGPAWSFGHMIAGIVVGLLGLLILGLTASDPEPSAPVRSARPKGRLRRRSTTGIRSLRERRVVISGAGR